MQPSISRSENQNPFQARAFKSIINIQKDKRYNASKSELSNQINFTVGANESQNVLIGFMGTEFKNVPRITYTLICDDNFFGLEHYIAKVSAINFVLNICNKCLDKQRNITVNWTATFP